MMQQVEFYKYFNKMVTVTLRSGVQFHGGLRKRPSPDADSIFLNTMNGTVVEALMSEIVAVEL